MELVDHALAVNPKKNGKLTVVNKPFGSVS